MVYKRHKYPVRYKALLHFDYPYPNSVAAAVTSSGCGGLRDEIGLCSWDIVGSVRFVGAEPPAILVAGTPKFGWRCPEFGGANDYLWVDASANRVATVYTNAPKRRRESIFSNLCTLLRHHGRSH